MERIIVSEGFRVEQTNTHFEMKFEESTDTNKALEAIKEVVYEIKEANRYCYADLWIQDLGDSRMDNGFKIDSTLRCDEFSDYIPAMLKAVAKALPSASFKGIAYYDDLRCLYIDEYEFSYSNRKLNIKETFMDDNCGYFCPHCGCLVVFPDEEINSDEYECDDCEETFKVSDLKFVPPTVSEETIEI